MSIFLLFVNETVVLWLSMAPYLLFGIVMAGLLHVFLGKNFIVRHLGDGGVSSVVKATLFGIPLPVCSCGVIPLASSLRKDGAHKSSVLSFLVSTPTTGIDSFFATYALLGPLFAIFRPLGAFLSGIFVGIVDYFIEGKKEKRSSSVIHSHVKVPFRSRFREFLRYTLLEIPQDIGKWLILGTVIGGVISAFVPSGLFSKYISFPLDFIVALCVGIPLYVCSTGSIPVAASLIYKGFSPGAGLIFLIAGPATNAITLTFVRAKLGKKSFYLYLSSIVVVAFSLGLIFNYLWAVMGKGTELIAGMGTMIPFPVKAGSAIILLSLIILSLMKRSHHLSKPDRVISVPDIHCKHCKMSLESRLRELDSVDEVLVDLEGKKIEIKGTVKKETLLQEIKKAGYHPEKTIDNRP